MSKSRKYNLIIWLCLIFGFSVLLRFYLAVRTGVISIYHDEPLYWNMSREIASGEALIYRGVGTWVKDILYPLILSPAHMFRDFDSIHRTMLLINAVLMSSAVFPVYLLAKAVLNDSKPALLIAAVGQILPEMFYSAKVVQECLYYPYVIWMLWLFFVFLLKNKYSVIRVAVYSALLCFAFYIKGIGNCLILAFLLFYAFQFVFCGTIKQKIKSSILLLESAAVCLLADHFMILLLGLDSSMSADKAVMGNLNWMLYKMSSYTTTSLLQLTVPVFAGILASLLLVATGLNYCRKKLRRYNWSSAVFCTGALILLAGAGVALYRLGYLRPAVTYVVFSCIFWGIFPIILPVIHAGELSEKERDLLVLLLGLWLIPMVASCFSTLDISTEVSRISVRIHYRYFYYPAMGFFILFLALRKKMRPKEETGISAVWYILCVLLLIFVTPARLGSMIDAVPLYGMQSFLNSSKGILLLRLLMILYLLWGIWMIRKKHIRGFYIGVFFLTSCFYIVSTQSVYRTHEARKQELAWKNRDGERLAEYFEGKEIGEDANKILFVGDAAINSTETTEVHLSVPYRFCLWQSLMIPEVLVNGVLQGGLLDLCVEGPYRVDGYSPQYIVSLYPLELSDYDTEQIGLENYYLYVRSDL